MNTARHVGWLIGQRLTPGGEWKYFRSNFRLSTPLTVMVEYTHRPVVNRLLEAALHEFIRRHQFLI